MKMEDKTRVNCTFYSLSKGEVCIYNGELYMKLNGGYDGVQLTRNSASTESMVGDVVEIKGTVEKVNTKIVLEEFDN